LVMELVEGPTLDIVGQTWFQELQAKVTAGK
jgi:hypothetical protein